jgi:hypothetical protein
MKLVSMIPRFAFMMAGLLFAGAQDDELVSAQNSIPSLSFWRFFLIENQAKSCVVRSIAGRIVYEYFVLVRFLRAVSFARRLWN